MSFIKWLEKELKMKENEDMAKAKKKEKVQSVEVTDAQLLLINHVKTLVQDINESGVEYVTYSAITKLDRAYDKVIEEANLKYQQMTIEHGEDKGKIHKAFWQDLVRDGHPNAYEEKEDD
tara:strand:- start:29680 stop:30039 length:360 start_codon:yes stop_codon:yes gene_type:complete